MSELYFNFLETVPYHNDLVLNLLCKSLWRIHDLNEQINQTYCENLPYDLDKLMSDPTLLKLFMATYPQKYHKIATETIRRLNK